MSLRGSLETFALTEVLSMVASTGKSGELQVDGQSLTGRVWLEDGQVVGAQVGEATDPADAVFRLLCLPSGEFAFEAGAMAPEAGAPQPVADVLAAAEERLREWREIEAVIPSADAVIRLQRALGGGDVHLTGEQWDVAVALGGGRSLEGLMDLLDQDELAIGRVLKGLVEAGLATVTASTARTTGTRAAPISREETPAAETLAETVDEALPVDEGPEETKTDLVRQLASLNEATYSRGEDDSGEDPGAAAAPGGTENADETVNRGMLLKFLSSVRS